MKKQIFPSVDQAKTYAAENWNYPLTKYNHGAADCNCGESQAIWSDNRTECLVICEHCAPLDYEKFFHDLLVEKSLSENQDDDLKNWFNYFDFINFYFQTIEELHRIVDGNHYDFFENLRSIKFECKIGAYNPDDAVVTIDQHGYLVSFRSYADAKLLLKFDFKEMAQKMASRQYRSIFIEYLND